MTDVAHAAVKAFEVETGGGRTMRATDEELKLHVRAEEICQERWKEWPGDYTPDHYATAYSAAEDEERWEAAKAAEAADVEKRVAAVRASLGTAH